MTRRVCPSCLGRSVPSTPGSPATPAGAGGTIDVAIGGVSVPAGASAVLVNLTGVAPTSDTYVAAFPAGSVWDGTSSFNLVAHEVARSNRALISLSPDGRLELLNQAGVTDLIVDVVGYVMATGGSVGEVAPIDPVRARRTSPLRRRIPRRSRSRWAGSRRRRAASRPAPPSWP